MKTLHVLQLGLFVMDEDSTCFAVGFVSGATTIFCTMLFLLHVPIKPPSYMYCSIV